MSPTPTGHTRANGQETRRQRRAVVAVAALAFAFTAGVFVPPLVASGAPRLAGWVRLVYAPLCHQMPDRSLHVDGSPLAVCSRCTGLYLGGALGLFVAAWAVVGRRRRLPRWLFFAAVAPTALDAVLPWIGLRGLSDVPRLLLALPAAFVAALYLALGIADVFSDRRRGPAPSESATAGRSVEVLDG